MKMLPILLVNLVVTGGALVIYDQVRSDPATATYGVGGAEAADPVRLADVETRLGRLENGAGQPALATGGDENLARRLDSLERALAGGGSPGGRPSPGPIAVEGAERPPLAAAGDGGGYEQDGGPSSDEVRRFRALMDAANEQRRTEQEREQLAQVLTRLEITMDEKQTAQYLDARRARQEATGELFRGMRRGPDVDREQVMEQINQGRAKISEEFAINISKFLLPGDAAKLVEHENNNRWAGGRMMGVDGPPAPPVRAR